MAICRVLLGGWQYSLKTGENIENLGGNPSWAAPPRDCPLRFWFLDILSRFSWIFCHPPRETRHSATLWCISITPIWRYVLYLPLRCRRDAWGIGEMAVKNIEVAKDNAGVYVSIILSFYVVGLLVLLLHHVKQKHGQVTLLLKKNV